MSMRIGLALLFVLILSGESVSQNDPLPPDPQAGSILIAGTQQVTPEPPVTLHKTDVPKTPALPKMPSVTKPPSGKGRIQLNPQLVAVQKMLDTATQMDRQYRDLYMVELNKLLKDPTMMKIPAIKAGVQYILDLQVTTQELVIRTQALRQTMTKELSQSGTK